MNSENGGGNSGKSTLDLWRERKKKQSFIKGIEKKADEEPALLSYGQERLWLLEQLYPGQNLYSYAHRYSIEGNADLD